MTPAARTALRQFAAAATPGPWAYEAHGDTGLYGVGVLLNERDEPVSGWQESGECVVYEPIAVDVNSAADAAYIAAVSPDVVTALLDRIDALEAALAALHAAQNDAPLEKYRAEWEAAMATAQALLAVVQP